MKLTYTLFKYLLATGIVLIVLQHKTYAGGFPVRPGSILISPSVNYFFANRSWDEYKVNKPFANGGKFTSLSYSLYTEYGISKRFAVSAVLPYAMNHYRDATGYDQATSGFTDLEVGVKYYLANIDYIYYFSVQGTFIQPLYNNINLGYKENGAEVKLMFAGSGHFLGKNYYFTAENGIRQYFGGQGPIQDRYNGTIGMTLDRRFKHQTSISLSGFYSTSSLSTAFNAVQVGNNRNFAFTQASLSYGYSFTKKFSIFLNAGKFIMGRNTGQGTSASASLILRP
ncbi:hypothetical protein ACFQZS_17580 [Mucilaginibacter calamicampi]|uniref:Transporter n=1 Tax=Mucilaginibacter calamicampi TaxID=1302352 RepID=A0ABW2Z0H0_9SPHI